jgi:hypothetical protein
MLIKRACPLHGVLNLPSLLLGGIHPPFPPIRRDIGRLLKNGYKTEKNELRLFENQVVYHSNGIDVDKEK